MLDGWIGTRWQGRRSPRPVHQQESQLLSEEQIYILIIRVQSLYIKQSQAKPNTTWSLYLGYRNQFLILFLGIVSSVIPRSCMRTAKVSLARSASFFSKLLLCSAQARLTKGFISAWHVLWRLIICDVRFDQSNGKKKKKIKAKLWKQGWRLMVNILVHRFAKALLAGCTQTFKMAQTKTATAWHHCSGV